MINIINALRACLKRKRRAVLVTILTVDGSVYQRDGMRCLIQDDGEIIGIISSGCVERDLFDYAKEVMDTNEPKQIEYDFNKSEDAIFGFGLGCNGVMTVWLQPLDPVNQEEDITEILSIFERRYNTRTHYFCTTVIESEDTSIVPVGKIFEFEEEYMSSLFESGNFANLMMDGELDNVRVRMFAEHIEPRPTLLIYGAGPDAKPLVDLAKFVEWRVVLVDHRPHFIHAIGFENADEIVVIKREQYGTTSVDINTFVVIMTHNYAFDKQILTNVIKEEVSYIGQLGPKRRIERMLAEIESEGILLNEASLEKLHTPIGLDIGAAMPNEIALSIMAEVMSRRKGCAGGSLRARSRSLHTDGPEYGRGFTVHG